jgi:hypothetical protein
MGLTLVEKQRASFIAEQNRIVEKNLLKQLKNAHKQHMITSSSVQVKVSRHS